MILFKFQFLENLYVLLFGKSKMEDLEYFLNQISADNEEEPEKIINQEICRKIQLSCGADVNFKNDP